MTSGRIALESGEGHGMPYPRQFAINRRLASANTINPVEKEGAHEQ